MSSLFIKVEALPGTDIRHAIRDAILLANRVAVLILLTFNQRSVYVDVNSDEDEVYKRWKEFT